MTATRAGKLIRVPSRQTLGELPARVVVFLRAIGTYTPIRTAMQKGGFTEKDHREGLALLEAVCRWGTDGVDPHDDIDAREAIDAVARWARDHLARLRIAIERLHPAQAALFAEIDEGGDDADALLAVATLLPRLDDAERSGDAEATAAIAMLARRGLNGTERARLAALIAKAQSAAAPAALGPMRDPREEEHLALYRWFADWTATARVAIGRKDWLRVMGLARSKGSTPGGDG